MKVMYEDNGVLKGPITAPVGGEATLVKVKCNGKPFFCWNTIPAGNIVGCDFTNAPIGTANVAANAALIAAITLTPQDVLTYDPPL